MAKAHQKHATPDAAQLTPVERQLADIGAWSFVAMEGVPAIKRQAGTSAEQRRFSFLQSLLPRIGKTPALTDFAASMGKTHGDELAGYPSAYSSARRNAGPSQSDLVPALGVLMRAGYLVVDGIAQPGITRSGLRVSLDGRTFVMGEEGDGSRIYWPKNAISGVTIGPGYDMGGRTPQEVSSDLTGIGVSADKARQLGINAAGKIGADAGSYVGKHKEDVFLTPDQQTALFDRVVPKYEAQAVSRLPKSLVPRLFQHEFDAIVSLAWNTAHFGHYGVNTFLNCLDMVSAAQNWRTLVGGGPGIPDRRAREITMFENAMYLPKSIMRPKGHSGIDASGGLPV